MKQSPDIAILVVAAAVNRWLAATGSAVRITTHDITITQLDAADGRHMFVMAFREQPHAPQPPINRQGARP